MLSSGILDVVRSGRIEAVVCGTSAGGVEALSVLLPALPATTNLVVIAVIHLAPRTPSVIVKLLAAKCAVPVREVCDKEPATGGVCWFAPPDYHLLVDRVDQQAAFALSIAPPLHFSRPSIDVLFESAADAYGERLMAMILTGASVDGAAGAARVQAAGGLVLVEDPATADSPILPLATLERCTPDAVASQAELADALRHAALARPR